MGSSPIIRPYLIINMKIFFKKKIISFPKLKKSKPRTPGMRHYKYILKNCLSKQNRLLKHSIFKIYRSYGKSTTTGHIATRGKHSGTKALYRNLICLNNTSLGVVLFSIYDPNRTSFISAVFDFLTFKFFYVPAIHCVGSGSIIGCKKPNYRFFRGFRYALKYQPNAAVISLLNLNFKKYSQYAKSAGTHCQILIKSKKFCKVRLPSGQIIKVLSKCFATLGVVSNIFKRYTTVGKAGRNVLLGIRPTVRGVAMNPVDHPHGGRTNGGCCWVTPWGKPFLFKKTSRSKTRKIYKLL